MEIEFCFVIRIDEIEDLFFYPVLLFVDDREKTFQWNAGIFDFQKSSGIDVPPFQNFFIHGTGQQVKPRQMA